MKFFFERDFARADQELKKAIALNPNYATALRGPFRAARRDETLRRVSCRSQKGSRSGSALAMAWPQKAADARSEMLIWLHRYADFEDMLFTLGIRRLVRPIGLPA